MRSSRLVALAALLAAASVGSTSAAAPKKGEAEEAAPKKKAKADKKDDDKADKKDDKKGVAKGITPYDQLVLDAHKAFSAGYAGGAYDDAISAYRKAIAADPARPEAHLYLGGALYHKGDFAGAEEALSTAASRAKADKVFSNLVGKALFLTATVKEALGKADEARTAWTAYGAFAKDNPDLEYPKGSGDAPPMLVKVWPASAIERETKIDNYVKLTQDYAKVKELVLKRMKELGIEPKK